jgi:hypothetical protein
MTRAEYNAWKTETAKSREGWVRDDVTLHNMGDLLIFRGGQDGYYVRISSTGKVEIGTYKYAIPHIGEAFFTITAEHQCESFEDAVRRVLGNLGCVHLAAQPGNFRA